MKHPDAMNSSSLYDMHPKSPIDLFSIHFHNVLRNIEIDCHNSYWSSDGMYFAFFGMTSNLGNGTMTQDKKVILIVDDEADLTWSMTRHMKRENANLFIYSAINGLQAFEMMQSIQPDLLITDLRMPGLNGIKLIEKARHLNPEVKIIVISAYYSKEIENKLRSLGINEFIEKPFDLKILSRMSDALLASQNQFFNEASQKNYRLGLAS